MSNFVRQRKAIPRFVFEHLDVIYIDRGRVVGEPAVDAEVLVKPIYWDNFQSQVKFNYLLDRNRKGFGCAMFRKKLPGNAFQLPCGDKWPWHSFFPRICGCVLPAAKVSRGS